MRAFLKQVHKFVARASQPRLSTVQCLTPRTSNSFVTANTSRPFSSCSMAPKKKITGAAAAKKGTDVQAAAAPTGDIAADEAFVVKSTKSPRKRKVAAVAEAAQGEGSGSDQDGGDNTTETKAAAKKPRKPSRAKKAAAEEEEGAAAVVVDEDDEAHKEGGDTAAAPPAKKPRGKKKEEVPRVVWNASMRPGPPPSDTPVTRIMSWNVAGLRAVLKKAPDFVAKLVERESPDIICLQETKISDKHIDEVLPQLGLPEGWHASWSCSTEKAGYSGVATLSRTAPVSTTVGLGAKEHDGEGRLIISEFNNFYLLNVYVPNSGEGLKRLEYRVNEGGWDDTFSAAIKKLQQTKPVIVTGDLNCAHKEIDIHNPKTNLRSAGFTQEERDSFGSRLLGSSQDSGCGLIDTYRRQYPDITAYTYYSHRFNCRAKGIGWRLDYFLVSESLADKLHDSWMLQDIVGSDHVPLGLTLLESLE